MSIKIPVSPGEVIDRMTILNIKSDNISDPKKSEAVQREWSLVQQAWNESSYSGNMTRAAAKAWEALADCNRRLWDLEDEVRSPAARTNRHLLSALYLCITTENDLRASLKSELNKLFGSDIEEVKEHGAR